MLHTYILSLGSNLGDCEYNLKKAIFLISKELGDITKFSKVYKTEPWGFENKDYFLNMAIELKSKFSPNYVINKIFIIENKMGRYRKLSKNYESRIIDIDIIFFNNNIINSNKLTIPHPKMEERLFVLIPLNDIIPEFIHPQKKISIKKILKNCQDTSYITIFADILNY